MFLGCSYFFTISEADVLINSVLRQNTACICMSLYTSVCLSVTLCKWFEQICYDDMIRSVVIISSA